MLQQGDGELSSHAQEVLKFRDGDGGMEFEMVEQYLLRPLIMVTMQVEVVLYLDDRPIIGKTMKDCDRRLARPSCLGKRLPEIGGLKRSRSVNRFQPPF